MCSSKPAESLKILSIGNSFAVDTMEYLPQLAHDLGVKRVHLGNLFIGGCSINRHCDNVRHDAPAYRYFTHDGEAWTATPDVKIGDAIESADWDWISIQHGTGDGSRYTAEESYQNLPYLIEYVRAKAKPETKIAFNMAWVMEPYSTHREIRAYAGDQMRMYENLTALTQKIVLPMQGMDRVSPTGTAIQNARATVLADRLSRDGFHLSYGTGRYIAGLTFLGALTGMNIARVAWMPEGMTDEERTISIRAAEQALRVPFAVSLLAEDR